MPIEIKELHIRVEVNSSQAGQSGSPSGLQGGMEKDEGGDKEAIVAECVEQVLQILQYKRER
jgi:hypothetical protein